MALTHQHLLILRKFIMYRVLVNPFRDYFAEKKTI